MWDLWFKRVNGTGFSQNTQAFLPFIILPVFHIDLPIIYGSWDHTTGPLAAAVPTDSVSPNTKNENK